MTDKRLDFALVRMAIDGSCPILVRVLPDLTAEEARRARAHAVEPNRLMRWQGDGGAPPLGALVRVQDRGASRLPLARPLSFSGPAGFPDFMSELKRRCGGAN